ncbi:hypothetical protein DAH55_19145 [Sphingomonas koreensis]|uniref:hypothetical protein n=2 Tax=Sphingomonas koreensis TaxID=93064 RepID=UPI000C2369EB|nr:hypothetical protein [Sphingomonas koreensis]RSU56262.1 hypothetical protein DAH56_19360 [Sphingomonas koreensis]RSU64764.1 hypothetical protein DAH55_19145 [Sphingomonas koreensis]
MSTLAALAALAACSEAPIANAVAETAPSSATADSATVIQTEAGRYLVDLNPKLDTKSLPSNADLKILDGDLAVQGGDKPGHWSAGDLLSAAV